LFDPNGKKYRKDTLLSSVTNPSYYLIGKMITGFYLGNGGGGGDQLEWMNGAWVVTKKVSASSGENYIDSVYWSIYYPLTGKKDSVLDLYRGVPIKAVLRNEYSYY
jgi:hypothetical protein